MEDLQGITHPIALWAQHSTIERKFEASMFQAGKYEIEICFVNLKCSNHFDEIKIIQIGKEEAQGRPNCGLCLG